MSATTRLYYTDSTLTEFAAGVVAAEPADGCVAVRLDRTAFYPTSGGQPNDTGSLGSGRVVDVVDREDGTVWHMVEAPPALTVGETVHGQVDWPRRFDHMQQHSGQHVLSAAFAQLCAARTVGFHLGERVSTIDLDRPLSPEQVAGCVRLLSVTPEELVSEIERVQTGQREQRRVTRALQRAVWCRSTRHRWWRPDRRLVRRPWWCHPSPGTTPGRSRRSPSRWCGGQVTSPS